jgi:hypothetical protein
VGQERLGPSYFFISLVLGPLNGGYKRKISVHTDVPLLGESTLIFENTL